LADQIAERVVNPSAHNPVEFKVIDLLNNNFEKVETTSKLGKLTFADDEDNDIASNLKFDDVFESEEIKNNNDDEVFMWSDNNKGVDDSLDLLGPISASFLIESSPLNLATRESIGNVNKSVQLNKRYKIEDSFEEQLKLN